MCTERQLRLMRHRRRLVRFIASTRCRWALCHRSRWCRRRRSASRWCANSRRLPFNRWRVRNSTFSSSRTAVQVELAIETTSTRHRRIKKFSSCRCSKVASNSRCSLYSPLLEKLFVPFTVNVAWVEKKTSSASSWHELMLPPPTTRINFLA